MRRTGNKVSRAQVTWRGAGAYEVARHDRVVHRQVVGRRKDTTLCTCPVGVRVRSVSGDGRVANDRRCRKIQSTCSVHCTVATEG